MSELWKLWKGISRTDSVICAQSREGEVEIFCFTQNGRVRCSGLSRAFEMHEEWRRQKARIRLSFLYPHPLGWWSSSCTVPLPHKEGGLLIAISLWRGREVDVFNSQYRYINATHGMSYLGPNPATLTDTGTASEIKPWFWRYLQEHSTFFLWIVSLSGTWLLWILVEIDPVIVLLTTKGDRICRNWCLC